MTLAESPPTADASLIHDIQEIVPLIRAASEEAERERRLPDRVVDALRAAGAYRMFVPSELGGRPADLATFIQTVEIVAGADGSAGWNLATSLAGCMGVLTLPDDGLARVFGGGLDLVFAGTFYRATGEAVVTRGGFRVTGRWPFGSGCQSADWLLGMATVSDGGVPRLMNGVPEKRLCLLSPADCTIVDTWDVTGLRGTGSHDIAISDVWVAESLTASPRPLPWDDPLYRFPRLPRTALQCSAIVTGIALAALDSFDEVAAVKTPTFASRPLREEPQVHEKRARAEALLESARAYRSSVVSEAWEKLTAGDAITVEQGARLMLAAVTAIEHAEQTVDLVYRLAGTTGIRRTHPLARAFRDIHVASQNARSVFSFETVGRVLMGLDSPIRSLLT
ncbi:MAG TPA: acyl-CoA dehydrogenase family protein [Chloroflexota bacterium]|nr:acyl-CoA dehydrogenase family protein [Chloroflexota bacterium]